MNQFSFAFFLEIELFSGTSNVPTPSERLSIICEQLGEINALRKVYLGYQLVMLNRQEQRHLDLLLDVHGHQIFVNGCFNGDPHPGNILKLTDGRLGLIDYGQFKVLTDHDRLALARIVSELGNEHVEDEAVANAMRKFGFIFKYEKNDIVARFATLFFDTDIHGKKFGCATPQNYLQYLQGKNPMEKVPDSAGE